MVLRCRANHRRSTDVDLLDALVRRRAARDRLDERIEVDDDEVERLHAEVRELLLVVGLAQVGEDACVHLGVQRLHPAVEALREPGQLLHRSDRNAGVLEPRGGRARGHHLDTRGGKCCAELIEAGLVVDADQRAPDRSLAHLRCTFLPSTFQPSRAMRPTTSTSRSRSTLLIRSCRTFSSSPSCTATATCAITGPVSMPASTRWTVHPVTLTP